MKRGVMKLAQGRRRPERSRGAPHATRASERECAFGSRRIRGGPLGFARGDRQLASSARQCSRSCSSMEASPLPAHSSSPSPEKADPCDFERIASALRTRVPGAVIVLGLGEDRPGDVAIGFDRGSDTWTLTLTAVGSNPLKCEIPAPTSECLAFAETSALIVERYLESIAWTAAPALEARCRLRRHASRGTSSPRWALAVTWVNRVQRPTATSSSECGMGDGSSPDPAAPLLGPFLETRASMSRALGIRTRRVSSRCGYL